MMHQCLLKRCIKTRVYNGLYTLKMWYLQVPSTSSLHRVRYWWIDGLILAPHRHQDGDGGSDAFEFWNYFFFFFMEAISCSAFDSCLAIADTWDEKESRWNEEVNVAGSKKYRNVCLLLNKSELHSNSIIFFCFSFVRLQTFQTCNIRKLHWSITYCKIW